MLNIGLWEMVVIAGIALIILGPEKFPSQAKIFLRMFRDLRDHWDEAKREITQELNPVKKEFRELQKYKPEELIDKYMGEDSSETKPAPAVDNPSGPGYPYSENLESTTGANEAPVEFGSTTPEPAAGRSESTEWQRTDETPKDGVTEEDEYRSAEADYGTRPKDGSD